ncbi:MAG: hypothetical protein Q4B85_08575 [Lachnospiraceae bacterium]|nr:hypothetical protein [Lachnospiraceae bacterium]
MKNKKSGFPLGIMLVLILTVGAFLLIVLLTKGDFELKLPKLSLPQGITAGTAVGEPEDSEEGAVSAGAEGEQDSMAGSYSAVSAVYNGMKMNKLMLQMAGYQIAIDVYGDGTFTASLDGDSYQGEWYRDGSYVELYSGNLSMTGTYEQGVLSLSMTGQDISVVLER